MCTSTGLIDCNKFQLNIHGSTVTISWLALFANWDRWLIEFMMFDDALHFCIVHDEVTYYIISRIKLLSCSVFGISVLVLIIISVSTY